ncbi:hypothetical protein Poly24_48810 [Rosistilla carotiformis]|uniref:HEAT repeat protein n=1 Tax=Rosistilla carotiformis TaxID=2528017 RepID=A0A518K024_9BACT|nr:hypothetical protein [Rosistilla carotiformis]QDV71147.1 hypothetical protein Poly24_48810 [Rosistilla carotiformis]
MKPSLELTYDYLGTTPNVAAVDLLSETFRTAGPRARRLSILALMRRDSEGAFEELVGLWDDMKPSERQLLGDHGHKFGMFVANQVSTGSGPEAARAVDIAAHLSLHETLPELIRIAESSSDPGLQSRSLHAVLQMAWLLGADARNNQDRPLIRRRGLERLAISVRSVDFHHRDELVDAFLNTVAWSDSMLHAMLDANGKSAETLTRRLRHSANHGVIDLLAGWVSKSRIPDPVLPVMQLRDDSAFRNAVLRHVGPTPSQRTLRQLEHLQSMVAFRSAEDLFAKTESELHAALLYVVHRLDTDPQIVRAIAIQAIEMGDDDAVRAASMVLRQMGPLPIAILKPEANQIAHSMDSDAAYEAVFDVLLWRQIQLLDFPCEHVQVTIRQSLANLSVNAFLEPDSSLQFADLANFAPVLRLIDPQLQQFVIDGLKHPIIDVRCRAVEAAAALGLIDSLLDTLRQIYAQDHLSVRIRIAAFLQHSLGNEARAWRSELKNASSGPVRDAARLGTDRLQEVYSR